MPIVIVVEDGTIVDGANSYVSQDDAREYAAARGVALSDDDDTVATLLIQASDYLAAQEPRFKGERSTEEQEMAWPRKCVEINRRPFPDNAIPRSLVAAQCALAMIAAEGIPLLPTVQASDYVVREKVGPIETEYADPSIVGISPQFGSVDALLAGLFNESTGLGRLRTLRI